MQSMKSTKVPIILMGNLLPEFAIKIPHQGVNEFFDLPLLRPTRGENSPSMVACAEGQSIFRRAGAGPIQNYNSK